MKNNAKIRFNFRYSIMIKNIQDRYINIDPIKKFVKKKYDQKMKAIQILIRKNVLNRLVTMYQHYFKLFLIIFINFLFDFLYNYTLF